MQERADTQAAIAYFSMEIALESGIPTYSGGLGVLAGDSLRAAADLELPLVAVTLVHREGYFHQRLDPAGHQLEEPAPWDPEQRLEELPQRVTLPIEGRAMQIRAWRYWVTSSVRSGRVAVYLLDTDLPENDPCDRQITDRLYGGDQRLRLCQEAVLGLGGVAMLRALGYHSVRTFHMNEGHSALLAVELLREHAGPELHTLPFDVVRMVRGHCVFTTHTPVPAGHDQFPLSLVEEVLGPTIPRLVHMTGCCPPGTLNMTHLALHFARYVNGVALHHGQISQDMYPGYPIDSITNGVHAATWASEPFQRLYDLRLPAWRRQNFSLRYVRGIPTAEIRAAHQEAKRSLLIEVARRTGVAFEEHCFTVGFARRATAYKRAGLLFHDLERLRSIAATWPLQVVYAGKAHPQDERGKALIEGVVAAAHALSGAVPVVYLEDYDIDLGRLMCAGVDLWLNTPEPPQEASGTSGMKAAMNGVPSLSVLDGWWIEGHVEGVTGWAIGTHPGPTDAETHARELYATLAREILPMYYERSGEYDEVMRSTIALNASFFNSERMLQQYAENAYRPDVTGPPL